MWVTVHQRRTRKDQNYKKPAEQWVSQWAVQRVQVIIIIIIIIQRQLVSTLKYTEDEWHSGVQIMVNEMTSEWETVSDVSKLVYVVCHSRLCYQTHRACYIPAPLCVWSQPLHVQSTLGVCVQTAIHPSKCVIKVTWPDLNLWLHYVFSITHLQFMLKLSMASCCLQVRNVWSGRSLCHVTVSKFSRPLCTSGVDKDISYLLRRGIMKY